MEGLSMATGSELNELKEAITALDKKVDRMLSSIENLKEKQDDVAKDISKIKEAVYHPDDGIYARLKVIETWKENQTKATWIALTAVIGLAIKQLWDMLIQH
jgi:peptidoglycan hydrolase CwlO-like protein